MVELVPSWTLAIILVLATVFSYWYYLRVVWFMWMKDAANAESHASVVASVPMRVALVTAAALILYLGVFPGFLLGLVEGSVESVTQVGGYLASLVP